MVEITLGRTRKSAETCLTCIVTKTNEHVTTSLEKSNALPIYFHVMLINISWFQWNYFWLAHMWNSPRDCHIFLFCHSSLFLKGCYCASTIFPTRGFLVALRSLLEPAAFLPEVVSYPLNAFFCLICQKNVWNKVAGLGQHNLSAQLPSCLVHPLLLSSSNYPLHESFCRLRHEVNISYSETYYYGLSSTCGGGSDGWSDTDCIFVFAIQIWEIIFCTRWWSPTKAF